VLSYVGICLRIFLLAPTGACRTVSTAALQVLGGVLPADLQICRFALMRKLKRNESVRWHGFVHLADPDNGNDLKIVCQQLYKEATRVWQSKWRSEVHGRIAYRFIPDVMFRQNNLWFTPSRICTYILTGYGSINDSLYKRGASDTPMCPACMQANETVEHILFHCHRYLLFRHLLIDESLLDWEQLICNKERWIKLEEYATNVFAVRKGYVH